MLNFNSLGLGILFLSSLALGSAQTVSAQQTAKNAPFNLGCVLDNSCPVPFSKPDVIRVNLPTGAINLTAPIVISPAEMNQGGWATKIVQTYTTQTPDAGEIQRLSQPLDLLFGEALTDATYPYPASPTKVKNPSVIFQVPISFTQSDIQFTGPDYTCGPGVEECVPGYVSDGAFAAYYARVEDCLSSSDHPKLTAVLDYTGNPIPCSTADGITGNNGFWYDIAPAWSVTVVLGYQVRSGTLSIPAQLPVPTNSVRIEIELGLKDDPNGGFIDSLYWGDAFQTSPFGGPEYALTRFAVQFQPITVWPAAFVQMKVLPFTILYRPPGDQSVGTYAVNQSFGTSMSVGDSTTIDNTKTFESSFGVTDDSKVTALIASVSQADGQSATNINSWDNNVLVGKGLTVSNSTTQVVSWTVGSNITDTSISPAHDYVVPNTCDSSNYSASACSVMPAESYGREPFWADRFVLLLHPQAALWDFNGNPGLQLLGAADFDEVSVTDLDRCARNSNPVGWTLSNGDFLSPSECQDLVALDPFYGGGQWINPSVSGRGLFIGGGAYGRDPLNPRSPASSSFSNTFSYTTAQSTNATAFYNSTVTNVIGFTWSQGVSLGYQYGQYGLNVGFSTGTTLTQGDKTTSSTSMKITYAASTVATTTTATQLTGTFSDDHDFYTPDCQQNSANCYHPHVSVFLDELFGSYMFQDVSAACNPLRISCNSMVPSRVVANLGQSTGGRRRSMPLPADEAAAVTSLRTIFQSTYAFSQAHPQKGYPASLQEIIPTIPSGEWGGYRFRYVPSQPDASGKIGGYQISAEPLRADKSKSRLFSMDQTGTIRLVKKRAGEKK